MFWRSATGCAHCEDAAAFLVAARFDGFFCRARELLSLTWADVKVDTSSGGAIFLGHTKVGQLNAAFEAGVMLEPMVPKWFERACAAMLSGTSEAVYMFDGGEARF